MARKLMIDEDLVEIRIERVSFKQLKVPTESNFFNAFYKHFIILNFNTNVMYWRNFVNATTLLTCYPIFATTKNNRDYEIIGGFRTYQILCELNVEEFEIIDISNATEQQLKSICIETNLVPLLFWSSSNLHSSISIKAFLKSIELMMPKEFKRIYFESNIFASSISRFKGRKGTLKTSKLSQMIEKKLDLGVTNK